MPYFSNLFSPLFVFIAVIFFTSKLAGNSEIIAMLAAGTSFKRLMRPYIISAAIIAAVNHSGDSDSTGSVAGNLLGASLGLAGIPDKYQRHLELKDVILEMADDLHSDCPMDAPGDTSQEASQEAWRQKYVEIEWPPETEGKTL